MLCLPGLTPVAKLDQAVGDSEGCVDLSRAKVPSSASALRFGSLPSSIHFRASVGSMPSKPRTKTRCFALRSGLPPGSVCRQSARAKGRARAQTAARAAARTPRSTRAAMPPFNSFWNFLVASTISVNSFVLLASPGVAVLQGLSANVADSW